MLLERTAAHLIGNAVRHDRPEARAAVPTGRTVQAAYPRVVNAGDGPLSEQSLAWEYRACSPPVDGPVPGRQYRCRRLRTGTTCRYNLRGPSRV
ncbi:hypothetical protein ACGF5T_34195 [Streptomyces sp. NPDC047853]|uniref:hypothetical protein n=1 Tax=unclassified Streptomyces TaxID=2593676 RepID=UPI0034566F9D